MPNLTLQERIKHIEAQIHQAAFTSNRDAAEILLLAVSKKQPISQIEAAFQAGLSHFGESYFQEALPKIQALNHLPLCWHFIGPLQSNKCKGIATHFDWVHSVERLKIAELLNKHRPAKLPPLQVCLQIQLINETNKSGILPKEAKELAAKIIKLPHLQLRGLMTIPPPMHQEDQQLEVFLKLHSLLQNLNKELGLNMDTLSMGMSQDFQIAIQAGSTLIRVGEGIFGKRTAF